MHKSLSACALLTVSMLACGPEAPSMQARVISIRVASAASEPVAALRGWADGIAIGESDAAGTLETTLHALPGHAVHLSWACPLGYQGTSEGRDVTLDGSVQSRAGAPLIIKVACDPIEQLAALVVRARGAPREGLPIRARDEVVGTTDEDGIAHILLRVRPDSALTVGVDTSAHPELVPQNPLETFQVGREDSVLLLDRTLTIMPREPPHPRRRQSSAHPSAQAKRPYRIH